MPIKIKQIQEVEDGVVKSTQYEIVKYIKGSNGDQMTFGGTTLSEEEFLSLKHEILEKYAKDTQKTS